MHLSRQLTRKSLEQIGRHYGNRDHTTVLHACRLVENRLEMDETIRKTVTILERQLQR